MTLLKIIGDNLEYCQTTTRSHFFFSLIFIFICLPLAVLGLHCCLGCSLVAGHRLPVAVVSLVAEHRL